MTHRIGFDSMSLAPYLPLYLPKGPQYRCPGEQYDISYSVHLARISSGYPLCRNCPHKTETGELSADLLTWLNRSEESKPQRSLFTPEGVRGIYLNELNRKVVGELAAAFARLLWERNPPHVKPRTTPENSAEGSEQPHTSPSTPLVLVGHDERPHSPDLLTGVVQVLRRMSCRVLDASTVPLPWFERVISEQQTAAAIYIGASGHAPAWSGLNFWIDRAVPCTAEHLLPEISTRFETGVQRPSRNSSGYSSIHTTPRYEDRLRHLFHALRPLKIVVGCASRMGGEILRRLLASTACELIDRELPRKKSDWSSPTDPDRKAIVTLIRENNAHLGCLIGEDLQTFLCFDETGEPVPWSAIGLFAVEELLIEHPHLKVVLSERIAPTLETPLRQRGVETAQVPSSRAAVVRSMHDLDAKLGIDSDRIWFDDTGATADGLMLLGNILQAMSRSDMDLSNLAGKILASNRPLRG
ncbi:MAG: hypothetical protein KDA68_10225 [Planctomycetaceae bacterium]|nr:hypothetical protein [Planctomycetaceae bacterium]